MKMKIITTACLLSALIAKPMLGDTFVDNESYRFIKERISCSNLVKAQRPCHTYSRCAIDVDHEGQEWYVVTGVRGVGDIDMNMGYIYSNLIEAIVKGTELEGYTADVRICMSDNEQFDVASKFHDFVPFFQKNLSSSDDLWSNFQKGEVTPIGVALDSAIGQFLRIADRHGWNHGWLLVDDKAIAITVDLDRSELADDMSQARLGKKCYYIDPNCAQTEKMFAGRYPVLEGYQGLWMYRPKEYPIAVVAHIANLDIDYICSIISKSISDLREAGYEEHSGSLEEWEKIMIQNLKDIHQQWNYYYHIRLMQESLSDEEAVRDFIARDPAFQNWSPYDLNCNDLSHLK